MDDFPEPSTGELPLAGLRVIDTATILAAPLAATLLGDFGAEVLKIEQPGRGDPLRDMGGSKDDIPLWWKLYARNKRSVTLDLRTAAGQDVMRTLVRDADVLVENFRPGTMERWGLGWEQLHELNPDLTVLRVSGFGRTGKYSTKPGFGTLCEGMSGFAMLNGAADGPPTVPPIAVGDSIAGLYGVIGVLLALIARSKSRARGQCVDVSLLDAVFSIIGYQCVEFDQLGTIMKRTGNRSPSSVPRNIYQTRDGKWITVSSSTNAVALRVLRMVGGDALATDARYSTAESRARNADDVDRIVAAWLSERDLGEALSLFEQHDAAAAPAYDIEQIFAEEQFAATGSILSVADEDLGALRMPNILPRLSETPGHVRYAGRRLGQDTLEVLRRDTTLSEDQIAELQRLGVV